MRIARKTFEGLVREIAAGVLRSLPPDLKEKAKLVSIVAADRPTPEQIELSGGGNDLIGLYEGVSLVDRRIGDSGDLPDRISLFRDGFRDSCATMAELRKEIRITILHELGHYFGFEENELEERGLG
ncbi:MAG: metallopeptidase family protein [Spirochaetes bacterium]|nr:metallopeptidase family protein [Spirochaetota bacterium]